MSETSNTKEKKIKPLNIVFSYNSYELPTNENEFLYKLRQFLKDKGLTDYEFFYRGVDGLKLDSEISTEQDVVFGMNQTGWISANNTGELNPIDCTNNENKYLLIYDASQLAEIYGGVISINPQNPDEKSKYIDFEIGEPLKDMHTNKIADAAVVHIGYPSKSPNDCLLAIVKIEQE